MKSYVALVYYSLLHVPKFVAGIVLDVLQYEGPELIGRFIKRHERRIDRYLLG
jgi:hypothetical protein